VNILLACAACFGQSDSGLARGMNWGIFSLLAVVVSVLGSIAGFSFYLARRSAAFAAATAGNAMAASPASGVRAAPPPAHNQSPAPSPATNPV